MKIGEQKQVASRYYKRFIKISKDRHIKKSLFSLEAVLEVFRRGGQCLILVSTKPELRRRPGALRGRLLSDHRTSDERQGVVVVLDSDTRLLKDEASGALRAFIKNTCSTKSTGIKYHSVQCVRGHRDIRLDIIIARARPRTVRGCEYMC